MLKTKRTKGGHDENYNNVPTETFEKNIKNFTEEEKKFYTDHALGNAKADNNLSKKLLLLESIKSEFMKNKNFRKEVIEDKEFRNFLTGDYKIGQEKPRIKYLDFYFRSRSNNDIADDFASNYGSYLALKNTTKKNDNDEVSKYKIDEDMRYNHIQEVKDITNKHTEHIKNLEDIINEEDDVTKKIEKIENYRIKYLKYENGKDNYNNYMSVDAAASEQPAETSNTSETSAQPAAGGRRKTRRNKKKVDRKTRKATKKGKKSSKRKTLRKKTRK